MSWIFLPENFPYGVGWCNKDMSWEPYCVGECNKEKKMKLLKKVLSSSFNDTVLKKCVSTFVLIFVVTKQKKQENNGTYTLTEVGINFWNAIIRSRINELIRVLLDTFSKQECTLWAKEHLCKQCNGFHLRRWRGTGCNFELCIPWAHTSNFSVSNLGNSLLARTSILLIWDVRRMFSFWFILSSLVCYASSFILLTIPRSELFMKSIIWSISLLSGICCLTRMSASSSEKLPM